LETGTKVTARILVAGAMAAAFAVSGTTGQAQGKAERRGGPRDWSHSHLIEPKFSPDQEQGTSSNWRTFMKHKQLQHARDMRGPALLWLDALQQRLQTQKPTTAASKLDWNLQTGGYGSVVGSPAKYSFDITASNCSDVIYFTVNQAGAASIVNVIAITNAYAGCPGNAAGATPTVKFGLRMGTGTATSAVPSLDGTVLYVVESRPSGSGGAILHAINVNNITTNPGTYNFGTTTWSKAHALAAPTGTASSEQLFQIAFAGATNNQSSPYLDYDNNQIFFGDSAGKVHRVTNTDTTSAAGDASNFPVSCGTQALGSPVFVNGQVVVASADGKLYRIDTTLPPPYTCIGSVQGGAGTGGGVGGGFSDPVIDITNDKIIVISNNAATYGIRGIGTIDLMFTSGAAQTSGQSLGAGSTTIAPVPPSFDDAFWSANDGNIYAAGAPSSGSGTYLIRVPYKAGTLNTPNGFATLARSGGTATVATSPVTEFLTASTLANPDFVFIGGGGGNYKFMNRIASGFAGTDATPAAVDGSFAVPAGTTSGIIIDTRTAAMTGTTATANIYFGTVGIASTTQSTIVQLAQQF
jgi:hypothetical protein